MMQVSDASGYWIFQSESIRDYGSLLRRQAISGSDHADTPWSPIRHPYRCV